MSLWDYTVLRDKFELDVSPGGFPCCACAWKNGAHDEEPCRTCDHNAAAVRDEKQQSEVAK